MICLKHFNTGQGEASNIASTGDSILQCISLDEVILNFMPNLIKTDIESAEHIWKVSSLIQQMMDNVYSYNPRAYGFNDFEVAFYAFPR
jgi:hypothetical protein